MLLDLLVHRSWGPWRCREFHKCRRCRRFRHEVAESLRAALGNRVSVTISVDESSPHPECTIELFKTGEGPKTTHTYAVDGSGYSRDENAPLADWPDACIPWQIDSVSIESDPQFYAPGSSIVDKASQEST